MIFSVFSSFFPFFHVFSLPRSKPALKGLNRHLMEALGELCLKLYEHVRLNQRACLLHIQSDRKLGVAETVFLVNRVFVPCQKRLFDENGENDELAFYPLKRRASLIRPPKTTKMTKMACLTQAKAWFRKSRACSSVRHSRKLAEI